MTAPPDVAPRPGAAPPADSARFGGTRLALPPRHRPAASLGVLDISEYYADRSGGVRTYLDAKGQHVAADPDIRRTLVIPGARDAIADHTGTRTYRLRGPAIPFHSYRLMLATRSVARILAHEAPDVVELGSSYAVPWVVSRARRRARTKVAWFYHSNLPRLVAADPDAGGMLATSLVEATGRYVRRLGALADVTLAASDFAAAELHRWGVERVERTSLGVDLELFTPARRARRDAVRRRHGLDDGRPLVGFVGRLATEKRVDHLLRAWPEVARRTGARLVIVGDGPQRERLMAQAAAVPATFLRYEADRALLADLLAALDLYVTAAPFETFGLAVCEALASGVPVVSVDHGAAAELVRASGAGGLAPIGDVEALAGAVVTALAADRAAASARVRAYAATHHAWEGIFRRQFAFYRRLVA